MQLAAHLSAETRTEVSGLPLLLSVKRFARLIDASYWTAYRVVMSGRVKCVRVGKPTAAHPEGRAIRVLRDDALRFIHALPEPGLDD